MRSASELKQIFQAGWNIPARIENYVRQAPEFTEGQCHEAWRVTLAAAVGMPAPQRVLDVGTGPGFFACLYSQLGHQATGLDFSERMLAVARSRAEALHTETQFVFGDAEEPPFHSETFDVVSSRHLLFNLPRPGVAVRKWVRLLKPGGRLVLIGNENEPNDDDHRERPRRERQAAPKWTPEPGYREAVAECPLFRHGSRTLRVLLEAVGLTEIRHVDCSQISTARQNEGRHVDGGESTPFFLLVGVKPLQTDAAAQQ